MDAKEYKELIEQITSDTTVPVEERIAEVLDLQSSIQETYDENDVTAFNVNSVEADVISLPLLIKMMKEAISGTIDFEEKYEQTGYLLFLYTMLMEAYNESKAYKPLKNVAEEILDLMRHDELLWEAIDEHIPVVLEILGDTIYNHIIFEMLILYLNAAHKADELNEEKKGWIRKLLRLKIILQDRVWCEHMLQRNLREPITRLMTSDELVKIILQPYLSGIRRDPVEYTREWEDICYDVEEELDRRLANVPDGHGKCLHRWSVKKEILKDKYDIDWRTPAQMNPRVKFD